MMIAALFVERGGVYAGLPDVEIWDETRDARNYAGPYRVIAHPPCQRWGKFWAGQPLWIKRTGERKTKGADGGCFAAALAYVRKWGGVLEHPEQSHAWAHFGLNQPPRRGPELIWGKSERRLDPKVVERMGLKRAARLGEVGGRGGGRDSRPRIGTPLPFRDLLIGMVSTAPAKQEAA